MTEVQRLIPPSIGFDPKFKAAAQGVDMALTDVRETTRGVIIYPAVEDAPEAILDHLAAHFHVDGYEFAEDIEHKRFLVQNFYDFHRFKGTVYGFQLFCKHILRRDLLRHAPPCKSYLGKSLTEAERAAFEAPHPEIRVYPFRNSGVKRSFFLGDCLGDPAQGWKVFPAKTDAILRIGDYTELYDPVLDQATPMNSFLIQGEYVAQKAQDVIEIRKPGKATGIFSGRFLTGFLVDHRAKDRLYTIKLEKEYKTEIEKRIPLSIQPSLEPITGYFKAEAVPGTAGKRAFLSNKWMDQYPDKGGSFLPCFPVKSDAAYRIRKSMKLFDPERVTLAARGARLFLGGFRLGFTAPHTGELAVDMAGKRIKGGIYLSVPGDRGRFLCKSDVQTRVALAQEVLNMPRRASDKVTLKITNRWPIKARSTIKAGQEVAGAYHLEVI